MGSLEAIKKPHAVCVPFPAQGHINPMLKLAKLLHFKGFHITFVNTEYNHKRLLKARGPDSLNGLSSFRFETLADGLPQPDIEGTQHVPSLCDYTKRTCLPHFRNLLSKLNDSPDVPSVSCVVSDGIMSFTLDAAQELGVPNVLFWTTSACGFMCYVQYQQLVERDLTPLKDASYLTNGYLETSIDWIPGIKEIRLKDIPTFIRTTDPDDIMLNFARGECIRAQKASAIILNTFDALEHDILEAFSTILPPVYSIGPLNFLLNEVKDKDLNAIGSNLWKEEPGCLEWLDTKEVNTVVYVNFGSVTVMTNDQLIEFAWGLAASNKTFMWVIRPDLVIGENAILPKEFVAQTKNRGLLSSWCPQEQVLAHPAIGGFLTHNGWNSTLESVCGGVPMICWPFFAEQHTNCRFCCKEWGIGLEIEDIERGKIESLVRELMDGEKGKEMKKKALEWKRLAKVAASSPSGYSLVQFEKMIREVLIAF
ncbi:7-deoxyloganetin glucosyltransferase-like [Glycine soja]|uniref:7-deoxyloganetin glucosyltransferase n=2 Tax=Glycine soja TaxID=3848 RepID=A0A445H7C6_GLYSO|nr:7-deoxyloganetin glucosyltransferase-like [Glycine soja]RZB69525.1 7-deoxyloganetin glucosyltransferase [Glycine soja]